MRFICDSYEIHMRFIWESFMLHLCIYIYIQKRKNTRSAWKWTELPPRIWPRCNTMQHHATKIKAEFVEQKSDAGLVDRTASFMTRLAPWWVFAVAILRNFIIHKIFRTHIYISTCCKHGDFKCLEAEQSALIRKLYSCLKLDMFINLRRGCAPTPP